MSDKEAILLTATGISPGVTAVNLAAKLKKLRGLAEPGGLTLGFSANRPDIDLEEFFQEFPQVKAVLGENEWFYIPDDQGFPGGVATDPTGGPMIAWMTVILSITGRLSG